MPLKIPVPADT